MELNNGIFGLYFTNIRDLDMKISKSTFSCERENEKYDHDIGGIDRIDVQCFEGNNIFFMEWDYGVFRFKFLNIYLL